MAFNNIPMFGEPTGPWIRHFAWRPVFTYDAGNVWMCWVWKRHIQKKHYLNGGGDWWWQYKKFMALGEKEAEIRREARQRCLDEVVALICGDKIEKGIGVDVSRAYYLAVAASIRKGRE